MKDALRDRLQQMQLDAIADRLPESVTRRRVLTGAAAGVGLSAFILPVPIHVDRKLSRAERRVTGLADTLANHDLRDPQQAAGIYTELRTAIDAVQTILTDEGVRDGQQVDDLHRETHQSLSFLPGITDPNGRSRTARRIATLTTAVNYYSLLRTAVAELLAVQADLWETETAVLYYDPADPPTTIERSRIASSTDPITELPTEAPSTDGDSHRLPDLLPPLQQITTQLHAQSTVYERHLAAQETYLKTGKLTETGAEHYETEHLTDARQVFEDAHRRSDLDIDPQYHEYALHDAGLTLGQYDHLFTLRREGLTHLLTACEFERTEEARRTAFNTGLDRLFDARQMVVSESSGF